MHSFTDELVQAVFKYTMCSLCAVHHCDLKNVEHMILDNKTKLAKFITEFSSSKNIIT